MVVVTARTPPSGILPFHTVISFRRCDGGICLSSMHPTTLEILKEILIIGLLPDVTERCYQVNVIYQPHLNWFLHHWPTVLWYSSLTDLCPGNNSQNECEGCTLSLKSAYRIYNVINNNRRCFKENYHLKWDRSNKYAHEYGVKK